MPAPPAIIVRRHVVDVAVTGTDADGIAMQRHLSHSVESVVSRALENAVGALDLDDDHLVVERLEVSLTGVPMAQFDEVLADAVRRQTETFLRLHTPTVAALSSSPTGSAVAPVVRRTDTASVTDAFIMFLRTGRLPWSFRLPGGADLESVIVAAWDVDASAGSPLAPRPAGWEASAVLADPIARTRLVMQFSSPFVAMVTSWLEPAVAVAAERAIADVVDDAEHGAAGKLADAGDTVVTLDVAMLAWGRAVRLAALEVGASGGGSSVELLAERAWHLLEPSVRATSGFRQLVAGRWPTAARGVVAAPTPVVRPDESPPLSSPHLATGPRSEVLDDGDQILVDHAGLVIMHPFLSRFFEGLGLVADAASGALVDPGRAVGLLDRLATGQDRVAEHTTTLAKLLCGVESDEPIDGDLRFTAAERDESEALLRAVIGHWDALGSTTPAALRAEFLTRPGLLSIDDAGDWVLRVEQRTIDILLGQLPWNISMVQTPWMQQLLTVEWRP